MAGSTGPKQHPDVKLLGREQIIQIFDRFRAANPAPATELLAPNDYTLLVSVVLSAQATDKSVNKATAPLYQIVDTPQKMLELGPNIRGRWWRRFPSNGRSPDRRFA